MITDRSVFKHYHGDEHFSHFLPTRWPQKIKWHRYRTKLRHCQPMYIGYGVDCSEQTWTAVNWHVVVVRVMVPVHVSPMTRTAVNQRLFGSTAVRVVEPYLTRTGTVVCTHHQSSSPTTHHVIVIVSSYKCYSVRTDSEICCSLKFAQYVDRKFLSSALQWNLALRDRGSYLGLHRTVK